MDRHGSTSVTRTKVESLAWNASALFFDSDRMDVDSPSLNLVPEYSMEAQYSHIQSPDLVPLRSGQNSSMPLASPFDSSMPSASPVFPLFPPDSQSSTVTFHSNPSSHHAIQPSCDADTSLLTAPSIDTVMRTPADFSPSLHAFKDAITPFGKSFELSDDWIPSGSYISPVIRASQTKQPALKLFTSPAISFMDRLKASSSPPSAAGVPPRHAKHTARSSPPLLSPCRLTVRASAKKENLSPVQSRAPFPVDLFPSSPLTSFASSPISRRPIPKFKPFLISPQRPVKSLFPVSPMSPLTPSPHKSTPLSSKKNIPPALDAKPKKRRLSLSLSESPMTRAKRVRYNNLRQESARTPVLPVSRSAAPILSSRRTLPPTPFVVSLDFPLFYRRFPASSYFQTAESGSPYALFGVGHPGGEYKAPRGAFDLYSARFVKGKGANKMGLCPICVEPKHRGGEGKKVWLSMKFSAFKFVHILLTYFC
ncbi:hypothetical protein K438DRAFT_1684352 [Mycena galopus ATCC 62051]|nr:hypothetical protein K438DRAFT_1684352 [Mycena galopus ATCC 62051]